MGVLSSKCDSVAFIPALDSKGENGEPKDLTFVLRQRHHSDVDLKFTYILRGRICMPPSRSIIVYPYSHTAFSNCGDRTVISDSDTPFLVGTSCTTQ